MERKYTKEQLELSLKLQDMVDNPDDYPQAEMIFKLMTKPCAIRMESEALLILITNNRF